MSLICNLDSLTCDYCDLQEIDKISALFLDKLTIASINKHPRILTVQKMCQLKNEFLESLHLYDDSSALDNHDNKINFNLS